MVTVDDAGAYLRTAGLITAEAVVDGDLDIISATRRNRNLKVTTRNGGNFFIKQPNDQRTVAVDTLRREALFYIFSQKESKVGKVRPFLPRLIRADLGAAVLILELLRESKPLWLYYEEFTGADFPLLPSAVVGRVLATIHQSFGDPKLLNHPRLAFLETKPPMTLEIHQPTPDALAYLSMAQLRLIRILQGQPEVGRELDELRGSWQPETVIHGDIKMDNFVVSRSDGGDDEPVLHLVDWELVQRGDPAWDLGSAFHDFVYSWVLSMDHNAPLTEMAAGAGRPLSAMRPAVGALWSAYCQARGLTPLDATVLLRRTVRYSAVRVIQTAYEMARHFPVIPAPSVLMLQIAVNLLKEPDRALTEVYGLTEEGEPG